MVFARVALAYLFAHLTHRVAVSPLPARRPPVSQPPPSPPPPTQAKFVVFGEPAWAATRQSAPGIAAYVTDSSGQPVAAARPGETLYLRLYAHTGGVGLTSFEVKIVEDPTVCEFVPPYGQPTYSAGYTGPLQGELSGSYQTELLTRVQNPDDSAATFVKCVATPAGRIRRLTTHTP